MTRDEAPPVTEDVAPAEWVDDNGHMNIAFYTVLVTRYLDRLVEWAQLGASYRQLHAATLFIGESHYHYRRELLLDDRIHVTGNLIQVAAKTLDVACEIIRSRDHVLAATFAGTFVNVSLATRRAQNFDDAVLARLRGLIARPVPA